MSTSPSPTSPLATPAAAQALAERIMQAVVRHGLAQALPLARPYLSLSDPEFDAMLQAGQDTRAQLATRIGASVGYEALDQQRVGQHLLRLRYLELTQRHPLQWLFLFYLAPGGWQLNGVFFNPDLQPLFTA